LRHSPRLSSENEETGENELNITVPYNLIQIVGPIDLEMTQRVTGELLAYDCQNQMMGVDQPIHLLINSVGGDVAAAWQICDIMDCVKSPVYTIGTGNLASAAVIIFITGENGHRLLSHHCSVMCHQYSWGIEGKYNELKAVKGEVDNIYKRMEDHFHERTGIEKDIIKNELLGNTDKWLTARQAKKFGITDKVIKFSKTYPFHIVPSLRPETQRKKILELQKQEEEEYERLRQQEH